MAGVDLDGVEISTSDLLPMSQEQLAFLTDCGGVATTAEMVGSRCCDSRADQRSCAKELQSVPAKPVGRYRRRWKASLGRHCLWIWKTAIARCCYFPAWAVDDSPEELAKAVSMAKGYASDAFAQIGIDGVGLHGAIGFTADYDAQLYLKRSKWARPMYGDSDYHLDRIATLGGL